ncbi:ATP-binding protein [Kineococcus gynurae]|uniref:histidine kinase n=1 Tax=Kineococcus gynurae TaxID=452979 RepID=A0ABV5LNN2_9ACTN
MSGRPADRAGNRPLRTASLKRRVVAVTVAVMAALLLLVGIFVDVSLGVRLRAEAEDRLVQLADLAVQLDGSVDDQTLVDRMRTAGASVVLRSNGSTLTAEPGPGPAGGPLGPAADGGPAARDAVAEDDGVITVTRRLGPERTLELSTSLSPITQTLRQFRILMGLGGVVGLLLAAGAAWWLLGRALGPLDTMTATARSIAAGDRGRRLSPDRTDTELGRTAAAFDDMLDALEGAEARARQASETTRQFLADAAHELRTPITGVVVGAERLLLSSSAAEDSDDMEDEADGDPAVADAARLAREETAARTVREARRAARLVADLLTAARLPEVRAAPRDLDPAGLLREAAEVPGAEVVLPARPVLVHADPEHVRRIVDNLLDNARRAAPAGRVRVELDPRGRVVVSDTGPGVAPADRERVFERLVRLDPARAGDGGSGLGLAIARGLAAASGATLTCVDPAGPDLPSGTLPGAVFTLALRMEG